MCQACVKEYTTTARRLLDELESSHLEVVLIPSEDWECARRGGMIRVVQFANAEWYQDFCSQFESRRRDRLKWRKFKTKIKRRSTLRALRALVKGKVETCYADRLLDFMRDADEVQTRRLAL
jgi:hypothetical protein